MKFLSNGLMLSKAWLSCSQLPLQTKLRYLLELCRPSVHQRRVVSYLGKDFVFDSGRTPFVLLRYPQDIAYLLRHLHGPLTSVLDIGGNVGQFSATLHYYEPRLEALDIFEANVEILSYLKQNTESFATIHPYGVGEAGSRDFFYVPGASGVGSLSEERASYKQKAPQKISVNFISDIASVTGRSSYDLVKIDVEGAELEVIRHIQVQTRYLWLEMSGRNMRGVHHRSSELFQAIFERFGRFDIVFQSEWTEDTICDALLEFS